MDLTLVIKMITICMMIVAPATCDITFNLDAPQNYETFVAQVRNQVRDPARTYYGLPIMKAPDSKNKYLYIQVNAPAQGHNPAISVTLQLKTADLYLVAYRDKDETGKDRAFYFKKLVDEKEVFPDVKNIKREQMKCDHDYASIEAAAGKQIKQLEFRLPSLEEAMRYAYGKSTKQGDFKKVQALFLLYTIEMTSEAARFKYIEQKTVKQLPSDVEVASLVTKWDKLSVQIVRSKEGKFDTSIEIQVAENPTKIWKVQTVGEIKPDMGILSYVTPPKLLNSLNNAAYVASFEKTKWDRLSAQMVGSKNCNSDAPVDEDPTKIWKVQAEGEIKPDMGVHSYVEPKVLESSYADEL